MEVDLFDYDLPRDLIADHPATPRDSARLLDLTGDDIRDGGVRDLPDLLKTGDILVGNDTRVIPARIFGKRGEASVEATLHKQESQSRWLAFAKRARRLKPGDDIRFGGDLAAKVLEKREGGEVLLQFNHEGPDFFAQLEQLGVMPLPPYIKRKPETPNNDRADYQTVYARHDGAVAAPTAGLHFTRQLLGELEKKGVLFTTLTLHVGAGTFLPVKVQDTRDHKMHSEWGCIDSATAERIDEARANGGRIVAIGTTVLRLLESSVIENGRLAPFCGDTDLFITPGFRFQAADMLLTNFHLPRSTLFMLVCAFSGIDRMKAAYEHAVGEKYRFYSYGDCCLLKRNGWK